MSVGWEVEFTSSRSLRVKSAKSREILSGLTRDKFLGCYFLFIMFRRLSWFMWYFIRLSECSHPALRDVQQLNE